jgi:hypothetical protein
MTQTQLETARIQQHTQPALHSWPRQRGLPGIPLRCKSASRAGDAAHTRDGERGAWAGVFARP